MQRLLYDAIIWAMSNEWCPMAPADDPGHCSHWYDAEPCCRCGTDLGDKGDL